ncbi:MAG: hypothetical protein AAGU18_10925 [Proteiniphilum sp.]
MITYVITLSTKFPATHPKKGQRTRFLENIMNMDKIHTIRANYALWKKRFRKIDAGLACLSLRYWTGMPYRSKQHEFRVLTKEDGIGVQKLDFNDAQFNSMYVNGHYCFADIEKSIANNGGLSFDDFKAWFDSYDLTSPMAIIHFTKFRY